MAKASRTSPLVPAFEVLIDGAPLPVDAHAHVVALAVDEDVGVPTMFTMKLAGSDEQGGAATWVDDTSLFSIGSAIEVRLGYIDNLETVMHGEVTGLEPEFVLDRLPALIIRGHDRLHRLQRGRKTRTFAQQKDSDVASLIASDAGLTPDVEDSGVIHDYLVQANQTDLDLLRHRAERIHYALGINDRTLRFRSVDAQSSSVTLTLGDDLREFCPRLVSMGQATEVAVRGWSPKDKKEIVGQARSGDEGALVGGQQGAPALVSGFFGAAVEALSAAPVSSQAEADQVAKARLGSVALSLVSGEGLCWGRTDLRAGQVVTVDGIGQRFGGTYYVAGVSHRYSDRRGYETRFSVRRNAS